jgi:nucleoside-triphosphatase THEP1
VDVNIWLVTGWRQAGKTSFCRRMAESAREAGWSVGGLLSPAGFQDGAKNTIWVQDIQSGDRRQLAVAAGQGGFDLLLGDWFFSRSALAWGDSILQAIAPCDLLIIDELGPLEFVLLLGWMAAFEVLSRSRFRLALVVVRPELAETARRAIQFTDAIRLDGPDQVGSALETWAARMLELPACPTRWRVGPPADTRAH